jgi:hypothetical protein
MTRTTAALALLILAGLASTASAQDVFPAERIARTRAFFERNAAATGPEHMDCITTLNAAARILFEDPMIPTSSQIDRTMAALQGVGKCGPAREIEFNDERGRLTKGVVAPHSLRESVFDTVIGMTNGARGWNVFGLSLMDGYHSITLNVDTSNPASPTIYWSDQWSSNAGFKAHTKETLDAEITRLTCAWWNPEKKFRTRTTLWRLTPTNTSRVATITSSNLSIRSGPGSNFEVLERSPRNKRFRILSQKGLWFEIERADGSSGWVHSAYVRHARAVAPPRANVSVTPGLSGAIPH